MRNWLGVRPARAGTIGVVLASLALSGCGAFLTNHYRMERARREMRAGEWQDAAFDLKTVLRKDPHESEAWVLLARLSLAAADPNGARSALAHALAAGAKGEAVNALRARVWLATGQAKALLAALAHHSLSLTEPDRTLDLARAQLATGEAAQAIATLKPLLAERPVPTAAEDLLATCLAQQGKLGEALARLKAAQRRAPKSPEPLLLTGRIEEWLGRDPSAERSLTAALARMPPSEPIMHRVVALIGLTEARLALGEVALAERSQAALAKLEPQAPETRLLDARLKLARKDLLGGTLELERVVAEDPDFAQARMLLGAVFLKRGDLEQAQQQLTRVVSETPDNLQARKLLADVQLKLGEPQEALSVLTPALAAPSLDPQLLQLFGVAARRAGNSQALTHALEREQRAHPHDQATAINLAAVYLGSGQAARALPLLEGTDDSADVYRDKLLILALLATGGPQAAGRQVASLLAAEPHNPGVLTLAAAFDVTQHRLGEARTLLRRALALDPADVGAVLDLARVERAQGDAAAAEHRLSAALAAHPQALPVRLALAATLAGARAFGEARTVLEAAPHAATQPTVQFALARVALAQGDLRQANGALDRAIGARPGDAALVEDAGALLMQANHYGAALARFTQATHLQPGNALYWLNSARAQLALNRPAAARASLAQAGRLKPHWLPVVGTLAMIDLREHHPHAALAGVEALIKREPQNPAALALKGDVERSLGDTAGAVSAYEAAQRLHPSAMVAVNLYQTRLAAHLAHPTRSLRQWLKRVPGDWRVRGVLANYYLLVAHAPLAAERELKTVLAQAPDDPVALNNLAWLLGKRGDPKARVYAERAYRLAPQSAGVNDTLGWILVRQGQGKAALGYLARAVKLAPGNPELSYHYAYALARTGRAAEARKLLARILSSPKPFAARDKAKRLLASLGA